MEKTLRSLFLFMANNQSLNKLAKKHGLKFGGRRFVAGETLDSAIEVTKSLNSQGMMVTLDHLGEFIDSEQEANVMADHCIQALESFTKEGVNANLSLKLTSLGLDISQALCLQNMTRILETAQSHNHFIRIDMEDYAHLEQTFNIYEELRKTYDNFGLAIQAYLYRSEEDVKALSKFHTNLRLVKGAYKESSEVAFPDKQDVDANFKKLIQLQLENGNYAAVATHDEKIIAFTKQFVKAHHIGWDQFEFQMLYGIRPELQKQLVDEGYRVRIYVPYGNDWFGYNMRRLAERPANVGFVLKGIVKR